MAFNITPIKNVNYCLDYYHILEIDPLSSMNEVKKAYKRLSKEYHPEWGDEMVYSLQVNPEISLVCRL